MAQRAEHDAAKTLSILVVRSGGFAGLRQQWQVDPTIDDEHAGDWLDLVMACPWDAVVVDGTARDAFIWHIEARMPRTTRTALVPDHELVGPWRDLVQRVQEVGSRG